MKLLKDGQTLIPQLEIAESFGARAKGLLGRKHLSPESALWINPSNSIHTFFMKFDIDLAFLDREMKVRKTYSRVAPGRLILPVWSAVSVIEFAGGFLEKNPLSIGDKLHVDRTLS